MAYTKELFEESFQYQDLVTDILWNYGITTNCYASKKYQINKGESRSGIEIKNDKLVSQTGNLYIETHEKREESTTWVESGILRKDNTKFWFIGDNKRGWFFVKKQLKALVNKPEFKRKETKTSKGVLIPISYFDSHPNVPIEVFDIEKMIQENENHIPGI